ncbi:MAG: hypothetical protein JRJ87_00930 [Deltaproteobacteria bacterium]|nr:hypothetical protein [Deltaproteobacteria bacterium]
MAGIGVILNRKAGRPHRTGSRFTQNLRDLLRDPDNLRETNSLDEIDDVIKTFLERNIDILGICGGDGTNHYTLSSLVRVYAGQPLPTVAFLSGGTHNAHAASAGIKGDPESLLGKIVQNHNNGDGPETFLRKMLQVDDGHAVRYGFSMATGFMYRFYRELYIRKNDSPLSVAALFSRWLGSFAVRGKLIRHMFQLEPGKITISNKQLPWTENNGISCSTMEKLGMGFTPYPRANETIDKFHTAAMRIKTWAFIKLMWDYKHGHVPQHPDQVNTISDEILLESHSPVSYVMDGEIYDGSSRLLVRTGPQFRLIKP